MLARLDAVFQWVVWGIAGAAVLLLLIGPRVVAHDSSKAAAAAASPGAALFKANCGSCHTLAAARTSGVVGPKLDDLRLSAATVTATMRAGPGAMPSFAGTLSRAETAALASFVAQASSR
jgi:cytochrome c6